MNISPASTFLRPSTRSAGCGWVVSRSLVLTDLPRSRRAPSPACGEGRAAGARHLQSHVLKHNAVDLVGHVVEAVDHLLEMVVDLDDDAEGHRVRRLVGPIELLQADVVQIVRLTFDL